MILVSLLPKGGEWYQTSVCVSFGIFQSCLLNRRLLQFNSTIWIASLGSLQGLLLATVLDLIVLVRELFAKKGFFEWFSRYRRPYLESRDSCLVKEQNGEVSTSLAFSTLENRYEEHS